MTVVLDSGALVAIERGDREMWAVLTREFAGGRAVLTHGGVVGQVWRGGTGRQARLARALPGIHVRAIDDQLGRRVGVLLGQAGRSDVIDAAVVLIAEDGDEIFTADAADLRDLARTAGRVVDLIEV
jgi:hypothetical protein